MRQIALGILITGLFAAPAFAQTPQGTSLRLDAALRGVTFAQPAVRLVAAPAAAVQAADAPPVSGTVGADIPSVYFFRGIRQESDPELTFQPFVDVGFSVAENATLNLGLWNSLHTGSLKDGGAGWYETDFYAALTTGMLKTTYTAYTYPQIDDSAIHEIMFSTTFNDSESAFPLAPSVALAFEFAKPSGLDKGIYLELGVTPGIPLADDAPVTISIPVKVGISVKDYYSDALGYISVGALVGVPVNDRFEVHFGATGYALPADSTKAANRGDSGAFVASAGFSVKF